MFGLSIDTVVQMATVLVAVTSVITSFSWNIKLIRKDIFHLQERMNQLSEAFTQLGTVLTKVAVQDTRITMLEKRFDDLSHGHGFVKK